MITRLRQLTTPALFALLFLVPCCAFAETEEISSPPSNLGMSLLMTILPIVLVGGFVWWFFKRIMVKNQTRMDEYIKRQKEHMERIEQTLERIAKAVEKKDPN